MNADPDRMYAFWHNMATFRPRAGEKPTNTFSLEDKTDIEHVTCKSCGYTYLIHGADVLEDCHCGSNNG